MRKRWLGLLTTVAIALGVAPCAQAIPAFARKLDMGCGQCHSAWPLLNRFGREFKENGYRLETGNGAPKEMAKINEKLFLERELPLAARIVGRLYDKRNTDERFKFRVGHEIEIFAAGSAFKNVSFFAEVEGEDEEGFELFTPDLVAGWHPNQRINLLGGWSSVFRADPYNTFAPGGRRLTRASRAPLAAGFKAGYPFEESTQFLTLYGRAKGLYYAGSLATGGADLEGEDKKDFLLRAAYEFPGGFTAGAFNFRGTTANEDQSPDFNRLGFDFQFERAGFVGYGVWYRARDDVVSGSSVSEERNNAFYIEGLYVIAREKEAFVVPVVRFESVESNDGRDKTSAVDLAMVGYPTANTQVTLNYYKQTNVPEGRTKGDRVTLQFSVAF